jgi:hypothetical protein
MRTDYNSEKRAVTAALAGIGALGVFSAAVPLVAVILLGLLALITVGGVGWVVRLWWTTRIPTIPTATISTPTATRQLTTASPSYRLRARAVGGDR